MQGLWAVGSGPLAAAWGPLSVWLSARLLVFFFNRYKPSNQLNFVAGLLATANRKSVTRHGARLNPGNGGEGKGSRVSQGDNTDTHVDPEPQITTASILVR
jgi:hypothetical protein